MLDKQIILYLKVFHGLFNFLVMLLFFYQGSLGLTIRRSRRGNGPFPLTAVKRHRTAGPLLSACGVMGFIIGTTVMYLDEGKILQYILHFSTGAVIVMLLLATYGTSRFIKGPDSPLRVPHSTVGVLLLALYVFQSLLGLAILQ